jgi:hypothetical protein
LDFVFKKTQWLINTVSYVVIFKNFINITLIYHIAKQRVCETVTII